MDTVMNVDSSIICGFAGCGKSTLGHSRENVVDLESTPFNKDWKTYVRVANHMKNNGYTVLVSCHKELREELHNQGIEYYLAMPTINEKSIYLNRYKNRGNTEEFIKMMDENFEKFTEVYDWEKDKVIKLEGDTYLEFF